MIQEFLSKLFLSPFSVIYGLGVSLRNALYDSGLLRSAKFNIPVISIGNLSIGGAGKTPHVEFLLQELSPYMEIATLSRGYKRKSKGFKFVQANHTIADAGDEALLLKRKFGSVVVAVSESRAIGIPMILQYNPQLQAVVLDDAYQHRSVHPGLNVLLTTYDQPFTRDHLLPVGRLREWRSSYQRANVIIVTKCPPEWNSEMGQEMTKELNIQPSQRIFFSYYEYQNPYYIFNPNYRVQIEESYSIILLSAIANVDYLRDYLDDRVDEIEEIRYEDHHEFTNHDISQIKLSFDRLKTERKFILTTEKDAVRLQPHRQYIMDNKLPIYVLPIQVKFHKQDGNDFSQLVKEFLLNFKI